MALEPGTRIGPYEIVEPLGSGGMGEVYRARDPRLERDVAVKVLPTHIASSPDALARFEREAKVVAGLSHPNITALYDFGQEGERTYAVMELLEGQTLRDRFQEGALPARKAREVAVQIARGLGVAHEKGVVHRDLKPENLFLTREGHAKILDFGLASRNEMLSGNDTATPTRTKLTQPGSVMGTVGYMSPEQVKGQIAEASSDLFSFGAVLFEMFTGRRAFQRETAAETMTAVLREEPGEGSGATLPLPMASIVRRCLEKNPHERFHSAHDLAFALEAVGDVTTTDVSGLQPVAEPAAGSRKTPALVLGAVLLLAAGFLAGRLLMPGPGAVSPPALELTRLTFTGSAESMPRLEPGGNAFLFVALGAEDGFPDIFRQRLGGEATINLTADSDVPNFMPAYSPDGQLIAFRSERDGGGIFIMGATGESVRRLTDFGFDPSWSPDGRSLLVADEGVFVPQTRFTGSLLWRVDVDTGKREKIEGPWDAVQPRYSPSGERIAYWGLPAGTGRRTLCTVASAGGDPVALTDDPFVNWNPVWGPDGRHLYFASDRGGRMNLWRLPLDEATGKALGEPQPVIQSTEEVNRFDIGTDGRIVVAAESRSFELKRVAWNRDTLTVSGEWETLLETSRVIGSGSLSPDGKWVAFMGTDQFEDVFVIDVESRVVRRLTNDSHRDRGPEWGGNSEMLYFYSDRSGSYE
ncbi:MAG: protein kinase, partial [bacterium]